MKKDPQKIVRNLSKLALVGGFLFSAQYTEQSFAMDAKETIQELQVEVPAQGRATLTVEDLQTLLGLKARDPSSKGLTQTQDVAGSAATFHISLFHIALTNQEKARVIQALRQLKIERSRYQKEVEVLSQAEINTLRAQRRQIQLSRTHALKEDAKLGRDLFDSLLSEANAKASAEEAMKEFDRTHSIEIQYTTSANGERNVGAIKVGSKLIWETFNTESMVAQR
jgi:hypothetical protein